MLACSLHTAFCLSQNSSGWRRRAGTWPRVSAGTHRNAPAGVSLSLSSRALLRICQSPSDESQMCRSCFCLAQRWPCLLHAQRMRRVLATSAQPHCTHTHTRSCWQCCTREHTPARQGRACTPLPSVISHVHTEQGTCKCMHTRALGMQRHKHTHMPWVCSPGLLSGGPGGTACLGPALPGKQPEG